MDTRDLPVNYSQRCELLRWEGISYIINLYMTPSSHFSYCSVGLGLPTKCLFTILWAVTIACEKTLFDNLTRLKCQGQVFVFCFFEKNYRPNKKNLKIKTKKSKKTRKNTKIIFLFFCFFVNKKSFKKYNFLCYFL